MSQKAKRVRSIRLCEAPIHVRECSGFGETKDHFTPKCIAKLLRWKQKQIEDPLNIQYLSFACHKEKDSTTPARLQLLKDQLGGKMFTFRQHTNYFNKLCKTKPQKLSFR